MSHPRQFGDVVVTKHRAYIEIIEAAEDIKIGLAALLGSLDPDAAYIEGADVLVIKHGLDYEDGEVAYRIDGWDAQAATLTAHKIRDTRQ